MLISILLCILIGYGFGCISTGYMVGKAKKIDIHKEGSGNAGATNALRTMGVKGGLLTFLGDVLKVALPVVVIRFLFTSDWPILSLYLGLGAVMGHNFPFWLKWKGGKGIAVTGGVILSVADFRITLAGLVLFICVVAITRYVSLGSLIVAWLLPLNTFLFYWDSSDFIHMMVISLLFTLLAYVRHKDNIKRLLTGTERKLGKKD